MHDHVEDCRKAVAAIRPRVAAHSIELSAHQEDLLIRYCSLLLTASETHNLTAVRTPQGVATTLILETLSLIPTLVRAGFDLETRVQIIDVGSGAGIPGIPLAIVCPGWRFTLLDSVGKKAAFLRRALDALEISAGVVQERAEVVGADPLYREASDVALARAVAPLPTLLELCAPLVRVDGLLAFPKGRDADSEVETARPAASVLGLEWRDVHSDVAEAGAAPDHVIVTYRKVHPTPPGYPRRIGLAKSRPIGAP